MNETKHTPGPWEVDEYGNIWAESVGGCRLEKARHYVAQVRGWGHLQYLPNGKEIQDANARLISAAPRLLQILDNIITDCHWDLPVWRVEEAREAIKEVMEGQ